MLVSAASDGVQRIVDRLYLLGTARRRDVDPELRTITITDDEALVIVQAIVTSESQQHPL